MTDLVGRTLGPYQIIAEIGHGGMANVYRAVQPSIGREVAIKVLPTNFLQDRTFLERFTREVQVIARLQHPRILPVHDFGEQDGLPYIVMAYMPGGTLADRIRRDGGVPLAHAARLVEQIAEGLDYAHEQGIIHRDFKPSNVLLDKKGNPYLSDFGIAKVTESTAQLTGSGIIGTPAYMAPEMSKPGGVSPLIDVYALGVTLFEMLSGEQPYRADTPMGVVVAHVVQPIPDIRELRPDLPEAVQRVIERAMAKDPLDRYPTAGELAADLRAAAETQGVVPFQPTAQPAPSQTAVASPTPPPLKEEATLKGQEPEFLTEKLPEMAPTMDVIAPPAPIGTEQIAHPAGIEAAAQPAAPRRRPRLLLIGLILGVVIVVGGLAAGGYVILSGAPGGLFGPTAGPTPTGGGSGWIAFNGWTSGSSAIWLIRTNGSGMTMITHDLTDNTHPTWSPDGERIAFMALRNDPDPAGCWDDFSCLGEIYVMNADGSEQTRITNTEYGEWNPAWSPDGRRIAYDAECDIHVMNADGSHVLRIYDNSGCDWGPAWSPDSSKIAFVSDRDGNEEIYVMNANGSGQTRLTQFYSDDQDPAWSPDGTQIAFVSRREGSFALYVMDANGQNVEKLSTANFEIYTPAWSPDGRQIAFVGVIHGAGDIFIMDIKGRYPVNLTNDSADQWDPSWQP